MDPSEWINPNELTVELFEAGRLDAVLRGHAHSKTCGHAILAQAVQGRYEIDCGDGRRADLAEGEAFLTEANVPLRIVHHGDPKAGFRMRARWLHVRFMLHGAMDATSLLDMPLRVRASDFAPLGAIIEERRQDGGGVLPPSLASLARRQELAFRTLRLLCALAPWKRNASELLRQKNRLGPALSFMTDHASDKIAVAQLARLACLSESRFHALFHKLVGRPPMKHLMRLRLSAACRLLATGDATLATVAEETGFCNEFHLSRAFAKVFGQPPGQWRREHDSRLV